MEGESGCLRGISGGISKKMELNATEIRSLNAETRGIHTGRIGFWADLIGRRLKSEGQPSQNLLQLQ